MLKFKITNSNKGVDVKTLDITDVELQDFTTYDVPDGYYNVVTELNDEVTYKFWVKDLFTIQEDSHLTSISNVPIVTEYGGEAKQYKYVADVVVTSVSKADKCLTLNVKKEMELNADKLYIETRYNAIMFVDNRWEMTKVTQEWLTEQSKEKECVRIMTNQSPYGKNRRGILTGENTVSSNNTAFYYENDSWKEIDLVGDDLEGCLNGSTINFGTIHVYDKSTNREAIKMEEDKIYYTRENYIILDFYPSHYFGMPDIQYEKEDVSGVMEMIKYTDDGKEKISSIDYPVVYFYFEKIDDNTGMPQMVKLKKEVHVEDEKRLVFNFDKALTDEDISLIEDKMFPYGYEINPITKDISFQEGMIGGFVVKRDNMMFDERYCSYTLTYDFAVNTVKIPISQKFENDLFHNDMIQKNFVDKAVANAINPIIDMEKDVYTPAIQKEVGEQVNAEYDDCFKIIFNLHFLEHRDTMRNGQKEKWICDKNSYWNGTRVLEKEYVVDKYETDEKYKKENKKVVDLKGRVYNYDIKYADISKVDKYDYFSYYGVEPEEPLTREYDGFDNPNKKESNDYKIESDKYKELRDKRVKLTEYQSDLLSYLGFTNDDVKYQKSKLKKSFLRISFYDSDNIANQNLLHTATIFLDSGDLFAKYIKNIETEDEYKTTETVIAQENPKISFPKGSILTSSEYEKLDDANRKRCVVNGELLAVVGGSSSEEDKYTVYDKAGMAINREPMRKRALKDSDFGDNIDELERLRMSSQIVVTDKNSSKRSSEGFYFYTYKTNDNGVYPSDIYMRVEFNHAGYGRVIPFMMPYIRKSEEALKDNNSPGYERYTKTDRKENKIKTFDDICYDWSEIDIDRENNPLKDDSDIGYSAVTYMKYCHIKWKYRYDKHTQKHIYYLDPDVYGTGVTSENNHGNNIILNLYEGKIR